MTKDAPSRQSFLSDVMSVGATRIVSTACTLTTGIILARVLGPDGRGLVAALTIIPTIVVTFSDLGIRQSTAYILGRKEAKVETVVSTVIILAFVAMILATLFSAAYFTIIWNENFTIALVVLAIMAIPMHIATSYSTGIFLGKEKIVQFNRITWTLGASSLVATTILVWWLKLGTTGAVIAQLLASLVIAAFAFSMVRKISPIRLGFDRSLAKRLISLGVTYAVSFFVISLFYKVNLLVLERVSDLKQVGIYSVGASLAEYIWQIPATMSALIFSRGANAQDTTVFTKKVLILFRMSLIACILFALVVAIAAPVIIPLIYGRAFSESALVLVSMLPGVIAFIVFKVLNMDLASKGKPLIALYSILPALILNLILAAILGRFYGATGAGIAVSVSYTFAACVYTLNYARALEISVLEILLYNHRDFLFLAQRFPVLNRIAERMGWL